MKVRNSTKIKYANKVEAGSILIAQPFWGEEIYKRVVVLILEHNSQRTTGILLNRKSNLTIVEALPALNIIKPLYYGGPCDIKIISYLHSNKDIPDSIYLGNELFWGGNFEVLTEMIYERMFDLSQLKFFAGFTYWSHDQLEDELNQNKWWVCELNASDLFTLPSDDLWAESLEIYGNIYSLFNNIPDPSLS